MKKKGLTLVEILVALGVFSLVMASASGILSQIYEAWQRQRQVLDTVQDLRWAVDSMARGLRQAGNVNSGGGGPAENIRLQMSPGNFVWYWRGDNALYGNDTCLYHGRGASIGTANAGRAELSGFIVDNSGGTPVFQESGDTVIITLTARGKPWMPAGPKNAEWTVKTAVWVRN